MRFVCRLLVGVLFLLPLLCLSGCATGARKPGDPVFNPNGGAFTGIIGVNITSSDPEAGAIHYTTDGSTPGASSPIYTGSFLISSSQTIRAILIGNYGLNSNVVSASFVINLPVTPTPVITPATGSYAGAQTVTITDSLKNAAIYYTTDGSTPSASSTPYTRSFTVTSTTTVRAIAVGGTGYLNSGIATSVLTLTQAKAATPLISPAGGTFSTAQNVSITDGTSGAAIYYTTDGSTPSASSTRFSTAFRIVGSATVKAIAVAANYQNSDIASASFTITSGTSLAGTVQVGKKTVTGAAVQLLAAGATGAGSAATVRSSSTAITDASGNFILPYTCGSASDQMYLVSRGGTPAGRTAGSISSMVLVTALGACGSLGTTYSVNEITTVAAGYALARFVDLTAADAAARIGATSTNATGIANAFLTASVLANPVTGAVGGPSLAPTSTLPAAEINTLAAIVASCGAVAGSNPCAALLSAATVSGKPAPADSFMALVNIAENPGNNAFTLFGLASGGAYTPLLSSAPVDWTLAVAHTGAGIAKPTALGMDGSGNVWAASYAGALAKVSPQGAAISPSAGYTGGGMYELLGLTIDPSGNVWVTSSESASNVNSSHGAVQKFSSSGTLLSGASGYGGSAVYFPQAAAADASGNIWIANYGNSTVAQLSSTGTALTASGGLGSGTSKFAFPVAVATDAANGAWFTNQGGSTITHVDPSRNVGTPVTCCNAPSGVAIDASGNIWATNFYGNSLSEVSPSGTVISAGYTGGGIAQPQGIAIDGEGNVWISNYRQNTLSEFQGDAGSNPGTPISGSTGFGAAAGMSLPSRIAIDSSGNLWATSNGNDRLIEFIGLASPVKTPLIGLPVKP